MVSLINSIENFASLFKDITQINKTPITLDIITVAQVHEGITKIYTTVGKLNEGGYVPGISTFSGTYRTLSEICAIVKTLYAMATCSLDVSEGSRRLKNSTLGALRGLVEIVPIVGNTIFYYIDQYRIQHIEKKIDTEIKKETDLLNVYNNGELFVGGQSVSYDERWGTILGNVTLTY